MKKNSRARWITGILAAAMTVSIFLSPMASTKAEAKAAYPTKWSTTMTWENTMLPALLQETDDNMIYRQLRLCMVYRVIPEGDIWDLNQARTVKMPLEVMTKLYNNGLISGYLYKKFSGEVWNADDLKAVFDPTYYYNAQKGRLEGVIDPNDVTALTLDFINNGMPNGYRGSASFDPQFYKSNNSDIAAKYGNDWTLYYNHYILYGLFEGRKGVK